MTTTKPTITRNQAIKDARKKVSALYAFGNQYRYSVTCDCCHNSVRESIPRDYYSAQSSRAQAMIDLARNALGLDATQYNGDAWTNYV
jgi:hypothetical protein